MPQLTALQNFVELIHAKFWYNPETEKLYYVKTGDPVPVKGCFPLVRVTHEHMLPYDEVVFACIHGRLRDHTLMRSASNGYRKVRWW